MNISEELIEQIVKATISEIFKENSSNTISEEKVKDPSGIILIKSDKVKCEPFGGAKGVTLKDVVTLEEAPRMGAGIMELDHTSFEWTLTYDEYDMVIDGELESQGKSYPFSDKVNCSLCLFCLSCELAGAVISISY
ncbi:MAG: ethanolamine utilization protein EutQ [Herbinix sp.]|nr:ethanolamine utilization protein EutQ [Herbinix sp.]